MENKFNPLALKGQLSTFGCKVLDNLIHQWKKDENTIKMKTWREYHQPPVPAPSSFQRKKKVLVFEDSSSTNQRKPLPNLPHLKQVTSNIDGNSSTNEELRLSFDIPPEVIIVPESLELVKSVDDVIVDDDTTKSSFTEMFQPNSYYNAMNVIYNVDDSILLNQRQDSTTNKTVEKENVNWNDMFGDEIFSDVASVDNLLCRNDVQSYATVSMTKQKSLTKCMKRKLKPKETVTVQTKIGKNKDQIKVVKKKKPVNSKTKRAVKQWLNNVNPKEIAEDELAHISKVGVETKTNRKEIAVEKLAESCKVEINTTKNKANNEKTQSSPEGKETPYFKMEVIKEKNNKVAKKTVQAQLAKKDGIMKFAKPEGTDTNIQDSLTKGKENDSKIKTKKARFVAPIKSQLPVKDMKFDIKNIEELCHKEIDNADNNEVLMILTQKNGFCQLNNHYTEDAGQHDGLMISLGDEYYYSKSDNNNIRNILLEVLNKSSVICFDGKSLLKYLIAQHQIETSDIKSTIFDAIIAGCLIDPDEPPKNFSELQKLVSFSAEHTIATECPLQKAAWYASLLRHCLQNIRTQLTDLALWNVFLNIEMKLLPIITDMELRGVSVDLEKLNSMESLLISKMKTVEQACYKAAGKVFQINSPVQVRAIIYDELKLDQQCNVTVRETLMQGAKSTSEAMLRCLTSVHELPKQILEYRHLHKAHATFLTGIKQHVRDGVVKPTWVQIAAVTGRIASNNPNLQAIPKAPFSLILFPEDGEENQQLNFRSVYTARAGCRLLAADFRHIECRVFAHVAGDEALQLALSTGDDIFKLLAAKWLNKAEAQLSAGDRERTKRIVYASLYGAGVRKLMDILHVSYDAALDISASFNRTFPSLRAFGGAVEARGADGELASLGGRARRLPRLASCDSTLRAQARRQAVNFLIQGSAADLCKAAMVRCHRSRLLLQIHDELVWELPLAEVPAAAALIKQEMELCGVQWGMTVPLPVALSQGPNWGEMEPLHV